MVNCVDELVYAESLYKDRLGKGSVLNLVFKKNINP